MSPTTLPRSTSYLKENVIQLYRKINLSILISCIVLFPVMFFFVRYSCQQVNVVFVYIHFQGFCCCCCFNDNSLIFMVS